MSIGVFLSFVDIEGDSIPRVGDKLRVLRIGNDGDWFPHEDNVVDYGRVIGVYNQRTENGRNVADFVTKVSMQRYKQLVSKEDFGPIAMRKGGGYEELEVVA